MSRLSIAVFVLLIFFSFIAINSKYHWIDPEPSKYIKECIKDHTDVELQLVCTGSSTSMGGIHIGGGCHMVPVPVTTCDKSITKINESWSDWSERHNDN